MRLWKFLTLLLTILQSISGRPQDDSGPTLIKVPLEITVQPENDTGTEKPTDNMFSTIAAQLNCTTLEIKHSGIRTEEVLHNTIFRPTTTTTRPTTTTELPSSSKLPWEPEVEYEYEDDVTPNPENESTEKTIKDDKKPKSKRSTDDANPSKNVTIHHNYSIVKKYPPVENTSESTEEKNITECFAPFHDNGDEYFWYQIIVENGGRPGEVLNATRLSPNATEVPNPCKRPIKKTVPEHGGLLYKYEHIEFERVYRREEAYLRFAGTPSEFVDVHGDFVWSPPGYRRRYYRLQYGKDDTGFYIKILRGQKCEFGENPVSIKCEKPRETCDCEDGKEICFYTRSFSPGLAASLIGG